MQKRIPVGKRIFRLYAEQALASTDLLDKELSFVLKDSTVFFGVLRKMENSLFFCENKRGKKFQFAASQIKEIVYDRHSSY